MLTWVRSLAAEQTLTQLLIVSKNAPLDLKEIVCSTKEELKL